MRTPLSRPARPASATKPSTSRFTRPEIFEDALESLVGQDDLKRKLVSTFSQYTLYLEDPSAGKPTVLVYGPSGSGKTYAVERLVRAAGLPFTIADGAALSPPGVKGVTLHDVLAEHWLRWRTDQGVIFIDEVDKWAVTNSGTEEGQFRRAQQAELLRHLHDNRVTFFDDSKDEDELIDIAFETKNTFWILAGAFIGIEGYIRQRLQNVYFPPEETWAHALQVDFVHYGMIDELINRCDTLAWVMPLTAIQIMDILRSQERPRWVRRFQAIGCELILEDGALGECAIRAWHEKTAARGAAAFLKRSMDDIFTEASRHHQERLVVDARVVQTGRLELGREIA